MAQPAVTSRLAGYDIPPLEHGDHLSREEFARRWELHPEIRKAELIDGQVYLETTVSRRHGRPHATVMATRDGIEALDDTTVRLVDGSDVQPDALLRKLQGTSSVADDECIEGPPELAFEIAASSASYDLHTKKQTYLAAGVPEYVAWQIYEQRVDWFWLENGEYRALTPDTHGIIESRQFPGLRLDVAALLRGDDQAVLAALRS